MSNKILINSNEYEFNELRDLIRRGVFKANGILVADHVVIGNNCSIGQGCILETGCKLGDGVVLHENVRIGAASTIGSYSEIFDGATIQNCVKVGSYVRIGAKNTIGEEAKINSHTNLIDSIFIQGTMHSVTYVGNDKISIGCVCEKIDKWKSEIVEIGKKHRYSVQAIQEYIGYIEQVEKFLENSKDGGFEAL